MKIKDLKALKGQRKISMLTAYDYQMAKLLSAAMIDIQLVGDSLGMVVLGYPNTKSVTVEDMIRHGAAVVRGNQHSLVVVDMPFGSCNDIEGAIANVGQVMQRTAADAVKIEGQPEVVAAVIDAGFAVVGHVGLKPQVAREFKVVGRDAEIAEQVLAEAQALEQAGCFSLVVECVPENLGKRITNSLSIPTIGIGAGRYCDGQVLVINDLLGMWDTEARNLPRFVRQFADQKTLIKTAVEDFKQSVENDSFPISSEVY